MAPHCSSAKPFRVLLVYPPASYVDMPPLGIATLQAYLKAHTDCEVAVWDSNLDFLDHVLAPDTLRAQLARLSGAAGHSADPELVKTLKFTLPAVIDEIEDARKVFWDPERFYDVRAYSRSMALIGTAIQASWIEPDPWKFTFDGHAGFSVRNEEHLDFSLRTLMGLAEDEHGNRLFNEFLTDRLTALEMDGPYDLICLSCANPSQFVFTLNLARRFRQAGVAEKIALGGSFITTVREVLCGDTRTFDWFDFVVTFEGERALTDLIGALRGGSDLSVVPNLHFRRGGVAIENRPEKIDDLNALPTPDFSGFSLGRYWTPEPVLPAYSTRGCFYDQCAFCDHHSNYFGPFRARSTENVLTDLRVYKEKYGSTKIFFADEVMFPAAQVGIAEGIVRERLGTRWYAHARVTKQLTRKRIQKLEEGGCTLLHIGMESANTRVLGLMTKGYDRKEVLRFLRNVQAVPITLHLNIIGGYPGERPDEYIESLETAWRFARIGDYVHLYPFVLPAAARLAREGSPFVEVFRQDSRHNLEWLVVFSLKEVRSPTKEEEETRGRLLAGLERGIAVLNEIYPRECSWAAHLLYVSRYRERGMSDFLDRPLREAGIENPRLAPFAVGKKLTAWSVISGKRMKIDETDGEAGDLRILSLDSFTVLRLPRVWMKALRRIENGPVSVKDLMREVGAGDPLFLQHLYGLVRHECVDLLPPEKMKKRRTANAQTR